MYYMDANIVKPLTAHSKLSYAELVGPADAMWFVSHWWGSSLEQSHLQYSWDSCPEVDVSNDFVGRFF